MQSPIKGVILVVDDIPANLEVLLEVLASQGHETLVATDGEGAMEQAAYALPDLILLDVMMPGIDGFETCRRLKKDPATCRIPVIFMTALAETADKVKGLETGAVDYITKPLEHAEVIARVNTHLALRRLQNNLQESNARLTQANTRINRHIDEIARLQKNMLPAAFPTIPSIQLAAHWQSYDRAGGDYYTVLGPDADGAIYLFLADVSGHGPAASMVVAMLHAWVHELQWHSSPGQMLTQLNRRIMRHPIGENYVTALLTRFDPHSGELCHATVGHPPPLLKRDGKVSALSQVVAPPLGVLKTLTPKDNHHTLAPKDTLLIYTDGLTETTNQAGGFLDMAGLCRIFASVDGGAETQKDHLLAGLAAFEEQCRPSDDQAFILLHMEPS